MNHTQFIYTKHVLRDEASVKLWTTVLIYREWTWLFSCFPNNRNNIRNSTIVNLCYTNKTRAQTLRLFLVFLATFLRLGWTVLLLSTTFETRRRFRNPIVHRGAVSRLPHVPAMKYKTLLFLFKGFYRKIQFNEQNTSSVNLLKVLWSFDSAPFMKHWASRVIVKNIDSYHHEEA